MVAVTLTLVSVILMSGSLSMVGIVNAFNGRVWFAFAARGVVIFFIGGLAETNRAPFDMPEAERELTGGFHTEYSGMRFALFFLAEYANMIVWPRSRRRCFSAALRRFPTPPSCARLRSELTGFAENVRVPYVFIWVRATLPAIATTS
jgi:NADH-quinone oxidoreductase subunit H